MFNSYTIDDYVNVIIGKKELKSIHFFWLEPQERNLKERSYAIKKLANLKTSESENMLIELLDKELPFNLKWHVVKQLAKVCSIAGLNEIIKRVECDPNFKMLFVCVCSLCDIYESGRFDSEVAREIEQVLIHVMKTEINTELLAIIAETLKEIESTDFDLILEKMTDICEGELGSNVLESVISYRQTRNSH